MRVFGPGLLTLVLLGCSTSSTNDNENASNGGSSASGGTGGTGGTSGAEAGGSGGTAGVASGGAAGASGSGGVAGAAGGGTGGAICHFDTIVINELSPFGSDGADEFVELYNPGDADVDLDGWALSFIGAAGGPISKNLWLGQAGNVIAPRGYFVMGGTNFGGSTYVPFELNATLDDNGGVAIKHGPTIIDSVAYGTVVPIHPYKEGTPALGTLSTTSLARTPNGNDCGNNANDFTPDVVRTPSQPN